MKTDAFGEIDFCGSSPDTHTHAKFIRVSYDTCPDLLYELLNQQWNLSIPNLLISVTEGVTDFQMKPTLKEVFKRGLIKVARNTGVWIMTDGAHSGVTKVVGEVVRDCEIAGRSQQSKVVTIGVATWGVIYNRDLLRISPKQDCARYHVDELHGHPSCLDFNHSYFILGDNGTSGQYGVEAELRVQLETFISKLHVGGDKNNVHIPVVRLVVADSPDTLVTMQSSMENGIPCVVIAGTGKIADVICEMYYLHKDEVKDDIMEEKLRNHFPEESEALLQIRNIMSMNHLLTIFHEDRENGHEIDIAIIKALLKARKSEDDNTEHELEIALAWNRPDIARDKIFTNSGNNQRLEKPMHTALVNNRYQFVQLFLDHGLNLKEYLKRRSLKNLYINIPNSCLLSKIIRQTVERGFVNSFGESMAQHTLVVKERIQRTQPRDKLDDLSLVIRQLLGRKVGLLYTQVQPSYQLQQVESDGSEEDDDSNMECERDLFIWSILLQHKEMSYIFWSKCKSSTAAALVATRMLRSMTLYTDNPKSILELAAEYEELAVGMFDHCFQENEEQAEELLMQQLDMWGGNTCLYLAFKADAKDFFSHFGVQNLLTQVWFGEMSDTVELWRVIACLMCPLLIFTTLISFRQHELNEEEMLNEQMPENIEDVPISGKSLSMKPVGGAGCIRRWMSFWNAPITTFFTNLASELIFLCIYAYVILANIHPWPTGPGSWEILLYFWFVAFITEELRQILMDAFNFGMLFALEHYISDFWNKLDLLTSVLIVAGMACRLVPLNWNSKCFTVGRVIFSLNFIFFCVRLLHIFTINKTLGPKILIVKKMVEDLIFFLFLLSLCMFAYGVATQSLLVHNEQRVDVQLRGIFYRPYLILFGDLPDSVNSTSAAACTTNASDFENQRCPDKKLDGLIIFFTCIYLLFANILLLNLLIAIFNFTFETVHDNNDKVWKYQRYELIQEYISRPALPPPFIIISHVLLLVQYFRNRMPQQHLLGMYTKEELFAWEEIMKKDFLFARQHNQSQMPEEIIRSAAEKVGTLERRKATEEARILSLHQQMENIEEQVARLAQAFEDKGLTPGNTSRP
uniref:transient receptor potential cation channel subfamily M member 2 n=1 Tax=Myxine glutinosa TaxID=7769 RepID=UPI00358EBBEA